MKDAVHSIEQSVASLIEDRFPKYEYYRSEFLIPLTTAPYDFNWRFDTHPELEIIAMSSFGIIKSLNYININRDKVKVGDHEQTFKNIYFHLGLVTDCIDTLIRSIAIILDYLKIEIVNHKLKLKKQELLDRFKNWIDKNYENEYEKFLKAGKPISYPICEQNYYKSILPKKLRSEYFNFRRALRQYRNFFIHNPGVDIFRSGDSQYTIKREFVELTRNWASLRNLYRSGKTDYFDNPINIIENDLFDLLNLMNRMWYEINDKMKNIYTHKDFNSIFKGYKREE